ncbi:uncharacterized protein LOC143584156 isoform X2 [Bidens hawaiensis]|uniref:uncharacterized protein LOC143584156 isoform X2 n=1 Tax=Bidens hawaiensis TaxID=980011 RepID=UPI004049E506
MGSLMAGWDSHVPDPKSVHLERNKSMTKEEIATYWRSKKNVNEEHGVLKKTYTFYERNGSEKIYRRSTSLPITKEDPIIESQEDDDDDDDEKREKLFKKHGWWINSRWAFLNEPPVISTETPSRYASQFHVATNGIRT